MISIAVDAMGGDFGEKPIIEGVIEALKEKPFNAILVGNPKILKPLIPKDFEQYIQYEEACEVFSMEENATDALKRKDTTIYKAIELVKDGKAKAIVSAGHSGASMSLATLRLGRLKGVLRPAIATLMPNVVNKTLFLDVGANTDCKAEHLFQFAIMGDIYARELMKISKPRLALLSNGEEECKGNELTKEAHQMMKQIPNFIGNAEGRDIFNGEIDILICDGFSGNVILKACEGVATAIFQILKKEVRQSIFAKLGALMMKPCFKKLKKHMDWQEYGGAPLLGVNGCVIISHGKSDARAIKNAIFQAINFGKSNINTLIENELEKYNG
ncbi:phosphate acyltransferase PlsX [Campylobacter sp. LH-2024]|uniref:Phosphate acyltransferase PlsX n=1 Tax=Campylobacter molothri TaxID=1032242 RepID=A0ACC5VZW2_9BACT|nr:phosphate acyltransferase PlsX [Campylobacter sp. RM10537]MBZ7927867.1 phosphate acyltransferase PlsX [Campylobacter sp. RM10542]MBZ7931205.1 phosphate acyltransferase PlsX [Campylobacter sp. RM12910]MBZ7932683.1 phosphate acyltransferase PlsX [Campylobacter sp. RM10543]MBZ7934212.1 phosphate acyltransferase PlsX [Campylobacter sp. W0065]MBZ7936994.1 phosphate acyltransferase PlsX [Campylobacter sp. RM10538]MBZ7943971.1 phosphate acyltransferase PlsX [Campylobacter sp. RM13744]MBZ7945033.